jgi:hypothetical protein
MYGQLFCLVLMILVVSCSDRMTVDRSQPLRGYWQTERNIIMSIHMSPGHGLAAFIKESPGFVSKETKPGTMIISQIQSVTGGGYSGLFIMPGSPDPVKVRMLLSGGNTLRIATWDRRAKGKIMRWTRVRRTP